MDHSSKWIIHDDSIIHDALLQHADLLLVPVNIPNFPTSYLQNSFILHVLTNGLPSSSVGTPNHREVSDLETWL